MPGDPPAGYSEVLLQRLNHWFFFVVVVFKNFRHSTELPEFL